MKTEAQRYQEIDQSMREAIRFVQVEVQRVLDETDPGVYVCKLVSAGRRYEDQLEIWKAGRSQDANGTWFVVDESKVKTRAKPGHSAHNVTKADGVTLNSFAADLAILWKESGKYISDKHIAWSLIPAMAYRAPVELVGGAFFSDLRDWGHLELSGWKDLTINGRLRG